MAEAGAIEELSALEGSVDGMEATVLLSVAAEEDLVRRAVLFPERDLLDRSSEEAGMY